MCVQPLSVRSQSLWILLEVLRVKKQSPFQLVCYGMFILRFVQTLEMGQFLMMGLPCAGIYLVFFSHAVLHVTIGITYNPPSDFTLPSPPYYRPGTSVTLTCSAHDATGTVSYQWSSTCSSCFASSSTARSIRDSILQSNDAGVHTCTVTDGSGNTGSNSTEMKLIGIKEVQPVLIDMHSYFFLFSIQELGSMWITATI